MQVEGKAVCYPFLCRGLPPFGEVGIQQGEQSHRLALSNESLRDLKRDEPSHGTATQ